MNKQNGHIFISYTREDRGRVAILAKLLADEGWSVWWDTDNLPPGQKFQRVIARAIQDASCVLVCWSEAAIDSDWVIDEANEAKKKNKYLPVLLEAVVPPIGFRSYHYIDLSEWDDKASHAAYQRLKSELTKIQPLIISEVPTQKPAKSKNSKPEVYPANVQKPIDRLVDPSTKQKEDNSEHIFISYVRDGSINQQWAERIEARLIDHGFKVWRDVDGIQPGERWGFKIPPAIEQSALVLCIVSESILKSEWVDDELNFARNRKLPVVPIRIETEYRPPAILTGVQRLDLHTDESKAWNKLFELVGRHVAIKKAGKKTQKSSAIKLSKPTAYPANVQKLIDRLDNPSTEPEERLSIGDKLAYLGDPRPGVVLNENGLPDIDWVEIPGGEFLYGEGKESRKISAFNIARYPITNTQFQIFINDGGYDNDRWWQGLSERITESKKPTWDQSNRPRETVSWYEAIAFCRWLSQQLGYTVQLSTEEQWERAAWGTDGREYPWGNEYVSGHANSNETIYEDGSHYLGQTSAVGLYPSGATPEGVLDLAGNVWEWGLNEYEDPENTALEGDGPRVLRGGSWGYNPDFARASFRYRFNPVSRNAISVFVLCVRPPLHAEHDGTDRWTLKT